MMSRRDPEEHLPATTLPDELQKCGGYCGRVLNDDDSHFCPSEQHTALYCSSPLTTPMSAEEVVITKQAFKALQGQLDHVKLHLGQTDARLQALTAQVELLNANILNLAGTVKSLQLAPGPTIAFTKAPAELLLLVFAGTEQVPMQLVLNDEYKLAIPTPLPFVWSTDSEVTQMQAAIEWLRALALPGVSVLDARTVRLHHVAPIPQAGGGTQLQKFEGRPDLMLVSYPQRYLELNYLLSGSGGRALIELKKNCFYHNPAVGERVPVPAHMDQARLQLVAANTTRIRPPHMLVILTDLTSAAFLKMEEGKDSWRFHLCHDPKDFIACMHLAMQEFERGEGPGIFYDFPVST
ncbi:hypothetical protein BCR37DRAFT_40739 [Protomyces lactucae-debilis]|uniref:Uncharacterized protein n=1 Tax=Protomyces lactucae-debilis TaxID=2754530 RepID=A0A1Y2FBL7_PROLT|nr:uncharacterized protein BCR37DRAFT_40739 [Protomyces lactucae-debilis]ORY81312.1 hypothetical protein BCR37DRAFT_40739 [Protomyces lactucae-debilis]